MSLSFAAVAPVDKAVAEQIASILDDLIQESDITDKSFGAIRGYNFSGGSISPTGLISGHLKK